MIDGNLLRALASKQRVSAGVLEKDYVLAWLLRGINQHIDGLVFKGGTALKKVYFPEMWRYSEDIDFTALSGFKPEETRKQLPLIYSSISDESGIALSTKQFRTTPGSLVVKVSYTGPYRSKNFVKIDVDFRESPILKPERSRIKPVYDCPGFTLLVYSLDEILAEKIRAISQRGKTRDYYDVWRLLKTEKFNKEKMRKLVTEKHDVLGIEFEPEKMFSEEKFRSVKSYWTRGLNHLVARELPDLSVVFKELRTLLKFLE